MNKKFNLSEWSLEHRSMIWYFIIVSFIAGMFSYFNLGRAEDPDFIVKTMIISAEWPGATLEETVNQVTNRIEKKLEEVDSFDYAKSLNSPGRTIIFVNLKDTAPGKALPETWARIRNLIGDIKGELPAGVRGPIFNDSFGDVYGIIYAFTADGFSRRQLRDYVENVRAQVLTVPNAGKVDLIGEEDQVIYLEFSAKKIASLGITQQMVIERLQSQNAIAPSGVIDANGERLSIRVSGQFVSEESLRHLNLRINDRFFRLGDIAKVSSGYVDPPNDLFSVDGKPAIALAIGMKANANLLHFGEAMAAKMKQIQADLPVGINIQKVSDQPKIVEEAVGGFVKALIEAVVIVLAVSFISLGMRAGFVVALTIPLVLCITFIVMEIEGVSLQRISLGGLIIALGLLVDDAMIAIEMMVARLELGDSLEKAATYVYTHCISHADRYAGNGGKFFSGRA